MTEKVGKVSPVYDNKGVLTGCFTGEDLGVLCEKM